MTDYELSVAVREKMNSELSLTFQRPVLSIYIGRKDFKELKECLSNVSVKMSEDEIEKQDDDCDFEFMGFKGFIVDRERHLAIVKP